jgi:hypothetical protein
MSDDVARAVGAGEPATITIAGKECRFRPLSVRELAEIERDCLRLYRQSYLATYAENMALLGDKGHELLLEKIEVAAKWDMADLPVKWVYDTAKIVVTDALTKWLVDNFQLAEQYLKYNDAGADKARAMNMIRRMAATALDQGALEDEQYAALTGNAPKKVRVGYVNWWTTASFDGMVSMIWMCLRDNGPNSITRDEICSEIGRNPQLLIYASREIEKLTAPSVGNG